MTRCHGNSTNFLLGTVPTWSETKEKDSKLFIAFLLVSRSGRWYWSGMPERIWNDCRRDVAGLQWYCHNEPGIVPCSRYWCVPGSTWSPHRTGGKLAYHTHWSQRLEQGNDVFCTLKMLDWVWRTEILYFNKFRFLAVGIFDRFEFLEYCFYGSIFFTKYDFCFTCFTDWGFPNCIIPETPWLESLGQLIN